MSWLSRLKPASPEKRATIIYRSALRENDARRADEQRRDWLTMARQTQSDAVRFSLLVIGGGMLAMFTLVGVILQARLEIDLAPVNSIVRLLGVALVCLIGGNVLQACVLGGIAVFALNTEAGLQKPPRRFRGAEFSYYMGWAVWAVAMVMVLIALADAFRVMPALFEAIQAAKTTTTP